MSFPILWFLVPLVLLGFWAGRQFQKKRLKTQTEQLTKKIKTLDQSVYVAKKQIEITFDSISDGIAVIDDKYNVIRVNKAYSHFVNRPISGILLHKCHKILRDLNEPCPECPVQNARYADGYNSYIRNLHMQIEVKNHSSIENEFKYIETVRDVTRFQNLQSQLRRKERLASIGTMVAGITHELNNPLSGITGNSQLMLQFPEKYGLNEKGVSRVTTIFESAAKAGKIVDDLLTFSNPGALQFEPIDIKAYTLHFLSTWQMTSEKIELTTEFTEAPLKIWANREYLGKLFSKILENAEQALQEKRTQENSFQTESIHIKTLFEGENILWECRDTGLGIPPQIVQKVFEPFYTTKETGKGVGLGLSVCHRIMAQHFGTISIMPLAQGTKVILKFPRESPL